MEKLFFLKKKIHIRVNVSFERKKNEDNNSYQAPYPRVVIEVSFHKTWDFMQFKTI